MLILPEEQTAANQTLAPPPSLFTADNSWNADFFQEVADYTAGHFALRQQMITADAVLETALFHVSPEEKVTLGRDGWLFYTETVDDYLHTRPLTQRQLFGAAHTLALVTEYAEEHDARLVFTVAPNKASLYPEYLPYVGRPLEGEDDIDRLLPLLGQEGVDYVDLFAAFRGQTEILYYRLDSHWTVRGAALAHDTLLSALLPDETTPFFTGSWEGVLEHRGDLYEMLYPSGGALEEEAAFDLPFTFSYVRPIRSIEDQRIETEHPNRDGSLLMFRDSFGNSLCPFLAEDYGHALFSRAMPWQMSLLDETGADTVILELVERNLDYLTVNAPIFPAPQRWISGTPAEGTASAWLTAADDGLLDGFLRLEGALSGSVDVNSPVYVRLGESLYEASLAGQAGADETPFTLYVPSHAALEDRQVIYCQGGLVCTAHLDEDLEGSLFDT